MASTYMSDSNWYSV